MVRRRLLTVLLVLLQAGLAARAHEHSGHAGPGADHPVAPHTHAHDLFDLFQPVLPADGHEHDGGDHDADAVYLTAVSPAPPPAAADAVGLDLLAALPSLALLAAAAPALLPLGLPPPTAGPTRLLYLINCSFRN